MTPIQSLVLAVIEGITEFLPVSSTGHMILADSMMKVQDKEFAKTFEIFIQLGAIMAVLVMYFRRFFLGPNIYYKLFVAFLPTGIAGLLVYKSVKQFLFNPMIVSISLIAGGVVLIILDRRTLQRKSDYADISDVPFSGAFKIGLIQCLSMIPGVSRAAATIFGGVFSGFDRRQAAEFSFLLAIPTMFAATGYDLYKESDSIRSDQIWMLALGACVAFIVAIGAVRIFISFVNKYGFRHFGYYRIALGILFLSYARYMGLQLTP